MALISIQNLTAPFENKTHLFTIVIVAAIFGIWRATGGSVTIEDLPSAESARVPAFAKTTPPARIPPSSTSPVRGFAKPSSSRGDLDSLLRPTVPRTAPAQPRDDRPRSALEDIEKSLGIR